MIKKLKTFSIQFKYMTVKMISLTCVGVEVKKMIILIKWFNNTLSYNILMNYFKNLNLMINLLNLMKKKLII
jgi:hypothetical protein